MTLSPRPPATSGTAARAAQRPVRTLLVMVACAVLAGCSSSRTAIDGAAAPAPVGFHGVSPETPVSRPSFVLTRTDGTAYDFAASTQGRPTYLYFGYTNCPDECPTAMADLAVALRKVSPAERTKALVVWVTTDPQRDSGAAIRVFLDQFSTEFIGLRGTQAQVDAAQQAAKVAVAQPEGPLPTLAGDPNSHPHAPGTAPHQHAGPLGYGVAHATRILAYDVKNTLSVSYSGGATPDDIAADLPLLLRR